MAMRGWSDDEIETAARMYAAGDSYRSIGAALRKHPDTVRYYIYRHPEFFQESPGGKAAYIQIPRYMRRCHDCGAPTSDYRCPRCWARLRSRGGYAPMGDASDMDTVTYGPVQ